MRRRCARRARYVIFASSLAATERARCQAAIAKSRQDEFTSLLYMIDGHSQSTLSRSQLNFIHNHVYYHTGRIQDVQANVRVISHATRFRMLRFCSIAHDLSQGVWVFLHSHFVKSRILGRQLEIITVYRQLNGRNCNDWNVPRVFRATRLPTDVRYRRWIPHALRSSQRKGTPNIQPHVIRREISTSLRWSGTESRNSKAKIASAPTGALCGTFRIGGTCELSALAGFRNWPDPTPAMWRV